MKRDLDLCLKILRAIESCNSPLGLMLPPKIENYDEKIINYHLDILQEGGLIKAHKRVLLNKGELMFSFINLTWKGHEFLDVSRNPTIWEKAKSFIFKSGQSFTFELLLKFLSHLAESYLNIGK